MTQIIIQIMPLILMLILIIASLFDLFNDMEIPISVGIIAVILRAIELPILERNRMGECVFVGISLGVLFLIGALLGAYGGADSIYAALVGLYIGFYGIYAILISSIISLPYALYLKKKKDKGDIKNATYPFVPYLLVGTVLVILWKGVLF